jgi:5-methylcytosine-specific restriction endonuclease McrA
MISLEQQMEIEAQRMAGMQQFMDWLTAPQPSLGSAPFKVRETVAPEQKPFRQPVGDRNRKIARILARDGDDCCYCGKPLGDDMTLEHRVAKSRGGSDDLENLKLAHARCNHEVGNLPPDMKDELARRNFQKGNRVR